MYTLIITAIRQEIERDAISKTEMARRLGVPQSTLYRILQNHRGMGVRVARAILATRPEWWDLLNGRNNQG